MRKCSPQSDLAQSDVTQSDVTQSDVTQSGINGPGPHGDTWVIRSHELARRLIRDESSVAQSGFGAQTVAGRPTRRRRLGQARMRPPILYLEGAEHRQRRRTVARHFAPAVTEAYRAEMTALADRLVDPLDRGAEVELSDLTLAMAVQVMARVVGLTNSPVGGLSRRLDAFFAGDPTQGSLHPRHLPQLLATQTALLRFYFLDVRPAIAARRKKPADDVIGQLLDAGYTSMEVLTECLTFGAAGMVTTREFISVAAWHLLDDAELRSRYQAADRGGRLAVLQEILRLEPVVGHLFRRTTAPLTVSHQGDDLELPVGTMIDFDLRAINTDAALVGTDAMAVRPDRALARGVAPSVLSFGDGNHRCPGAPIAIMESEILLSRLFDRPLVAAGPPDVTWNGVTHGYELRGFQVRRPSSR